MVQLRDTWLKYYQLKCKTLNAPLIYYCMDHRTFNLLFLNGRKIYASVATILYIFWLALSQKRTDDDKRTITLPPPRCLLEMLPL